MENQIVIVVPNHGRVVTPKRLDKSSAKENWWLKTGITPLRRGDINMVLLFGSGILIPRAVSGKGGVSVPPDSDSRSYFTRQRRPTD